MTCLCLQRWPGSRARRCWPRTEWAGSQLLDHNEAKNKRARREGAYIHAQPLARSHTHAQTCCRKPHNCKWTLHTPFPYPDRNIAFARAHRRCRATYQQMNKTDLPHLYLRSDVTCTRTQIRTLLHLHMKAEENHTSADNQGKPLHLCTYRSITHTDKDK